MSDVIIRAENISKQYKIGAQQEPYGSLRESLVRALTTPFRRKSKVEDRYIWALKDVSFEIKRGEVVGIIGRNGAGKSTLLKILSRITKPTTGHVRMYGRVGSLLEVGTGFHPELTGRENIYLNGAILGMRRYEIEKKFDEIVDFAEIEKFLDTPVKRYSSGMYVRLAFAVAAHLEPEILLVDEVLAVGDAEFQRKCLGKMGEVAQGGRTVLFVSHNMAAIQQLCGKTILINNGNLVDFDFTQLIVSIYLSSHIYQRGEFQFLPSQQTQKNFPVELRRVSVKNLSNQVTSNVDMGSPFFIEIEYAINLELDNVRIGYRLSKDNGIVVYTSSDTDPDGRGIFRPRGIFTSRCQVPANLLNGGEYFITATCDHPMQEIIFIEERIVSFYVEMITGVGVAIPDGRWGVIRPSLDWQIYRN